MKRASQKKGDEHLHRIEGVLARVYRKNGYEAVENRTPLSVLINGEFAVDHEDDEIAEARQRTLGLMLEYIFADGPHPGCSMRRLYALARAVRPKLIAEMNGTDLAEIFDESRAAQSWRCLRMFDGYMKSRGAHSGQMPFNKGSDARRNYSDAQRGNKNRLGTGKK